MFIDWGLYSVAAYAPSGYPDWYLHRAFYGDTREYHEKFWGKDFRRDDFIPLFTAKDFDAEKIAEAAQAAGMKYVVPFLKHHDGFCLWDSSFTKRNSVEMGPRRDIARQLAQSLRKRGLKFGFYYSIDDWEYPILGKDGRLEVRLWETPGAPEYSQEKWARMFSGKIPVRNFYDEYINPAAAEFFDKYDPDIFWGDGDWGGRDATGRGIRPIIACFLNRAEGRKEVVFNDRLGLCRGTPKTPVAQQPNAHGDFWTSEGDYKPGEALVADHAWEECHGLSHSFGYNWRETDQDVRSAKELLHMLIDVVANGGNLLLITNLTPTGKLDPMMTSRLREVGAWLKINGEAIYATRKWTTFRQDSLRFTRSKDGRFVYVICLEWPGRQVIVKNLHAVNGSTIRLLGRTEALPWRQTADGLVIEIPESVAADRPCDYAWAFQVEAQPALAVEELRCEYARNPLGIDVAAPRLSWCLESSERGQKQTAYQVLVASRPELLFKDNGDLWNSGKVNSNQSSQVVYAGKPLASRMHCFWKVRAWDKDGKASAWSQRATWSMALLNSEDWRAKWMRFGKPPFWLYSYCTRESRDTHSFP